jgi:chromosome segregation ATPase
MKASFDDLRRHLQGIDE